MLCVQALHHNTKANIEKVAREIERVVKNGGLIFVTVPKLKNQGKTFEEIEPGTFVPLDGQEKGLPHHYFSEIELKELFKNFQVEDIHTDNLDHYCLTAILL